MTMAEQPPVQITINGIKRIALGYDNNLNMTTPCPFVIRGS